MRYFAYQLIRGRGQAQQGRLNHVKMLIALTTGLWAEGIHSSSPCVTMCPVMGTGIESCGCARVPL